MNFLTRKEELILLAILQLDDKASLVKIREYLIATTGKKWSVGNVYVPLNKMSRLEYLDIWIGEPIAQRGGKAVKYYSLSKKGKRALADIKKVHDVMWAGISSLVLEKNK